jgi:hypothetical protein
MSGCVSALPSTSRVRPVGVRPTQGGEETQAGHPRAAHSPKARIAVPQDIGSPRGPTVSHPPRERNRTNRVPAGRAFGHVAKKASARPPGSRPRRAAGGRTRPEERQLQQRSLIEWTRDRQEPEACEPSERPRYAPIRSCDLDRPDRPRDEDDGRAHRTGVYGPVRGVSPRFAIPFTDWAKYVPLGGVSPRLNLGAWPRLAGGGRRFSSRALRASRPSATGPVRSRGCMSRSRRGARLPVGPRW